MLPPEVGSVQSRLICHPCVDCSILSTWKRWSGRSRWRQARLCRWPRRCVWDQRATCMEYRPATAPYAWPLPVSDCSSSQYDTVFNPLWAHPQSSGPLYRNPVVGWYTGRWWVCCCIWYSEEGPGRVAAPPSPLLAVPNVTAHPSTASVPTSYYSMWHIIAFEL